MVITIVWLMVMLKASMLHQHQFQFQIYHQVVKQIHTQSIYTELHQILYLYQRVNILLTLHFHFLGPCNNSPKSPCLNGGRCHNKNWKGGYYSDYTCSCPLSYYGKNCQYNGNFEFSYNAKTIFIIIPIYYQFNKHISYIISFWSVFVYFMNQNSTWRTEEV